jgi:hypothetical protein
MKIAQIAPLYEAVPPSLYGGTERIVGTRQFVLHVRMTRQLAWRMVRPMPAELPKPSPPPLSGLSLTVVKPRLLRWCLTQNIHYAYLALAVALILAAMLA